MGDLHPIMPHDGMHACKNPCLYIFGPYNDGHRTNPHRFVAAWALPCSLRIFSQSRELLDGETKAASSLEVVEAGIIPVRGL